MNISLKEGNNLDGVYITCIIYNICIHYYKSYTF